jgi:uncharacterized protein YprB with RNaseH-like and TPR domain
MTEQISCCVFDLETTNLSADFGVILCGVIKPAGGKARVFRADHLNPRWPRGRSDDSHTLRAIVEELDKWDIWIVHNGNRFDIPFLRTRLLKHHLPALPSKKLVDPVLLARNKLRMSYNSLEQIANHMGVNSKTEVHPDLWVKAGLDGDRRAMSYIVKHCVEDVKTLEKVAGQLKVYSSTYNTYGSGY